MAGASKRMVVDATSTRAGGGATSNRTVDVAARPAGATLDPSAGAVVTELLPGVVAFVEAHVPEEEHCRGRPFADWLRSGVVLGRLANALRPGSVKVSSSPLPFKQMDNIAKFLRACRALGVARTDLFETLDLYRERNVGSVVRGLDALRRRVGGLGYAAPRATPVAGAAPRSFRMKRPVAAPPPRPVNAAARSGSARGLDAELAAARAAKYAELSAEGVEARVAEFVAALAPSPPRPSDATLGEWLHDGSVLCDAANALTPGLIPRVNRGARLNAWRALDNITRFMRACRTLGLRENDLFNPLDLLHQSDMVSVVSCLDSLRRLTEGGYAGYTPTRRAAALSAPPRLEANYRDQFFGAAGGGAAVPPPINHSGAVTTSGRALFGMEAEDYARRAAKWEALQASGAEDEAVAFVEAAASGEAPRADGESLQGWLGDGVVLCAVANALRPGAIKKINRGSKLAFKHLENLSAFTRFCREVVGLATADIFDPLDLYHGRENTAVVICLLALKRAVAAARGTGRGHER